MINFLIGKLPQETLLSLYCQAIGQKKKVSVAISLFTLGSLVSFPLFNIHSEFL